MGRINFGPHAIGLWKLFKMRVQGLLERLRFGAPYKSIVQDGYTAKRVDLVVQLEGCSLEEALKHLWKVWLQIEVESMLTEFADDKARAGGKEDKQLRRRAKSLAKLLKFCDDLGIEIRNRQRASSI